MAQRGSRRGSPTLAEIGWNILAFTLLTCFMLIPFIIIFTAITIGFGAIEYDTGIKIILGFTISWIVMTFIGMFAVEMGAIEERRFVGDAGEDVDV